MTNDTSRMEADLFRAAAAAIAAIKTNDRISDGMKVDMLKTLKGEIGFAIDQLQNPRSSVVTDDEFRELVG